MTPTLIPHTGAGLDWPALVTLCERRGIPVMRIDRAGRGHIIRSFEQFRTEWEA